MQYYCLSTVSLKNTSPCKHINEPLDLIKQGESDQLSCYKLFKNDSALWNYSKKMDKRKGI